MLKLASARDRMVEAQVASRGIRNHHVLDAMQRVMSSRRRMGTVCCAAWKIAPRLGVIGVEN